MKKLRHRKGNDLPEPTAAEQSVSRAREVKSWGVQLGGEYYQAQTRADAWYSSAPTH